MHDSTTVSARSEKILLARCASCNKSFYYPNGKNYLNLIILESSCNEEHTCICKSL